jgi:hexosaminidase
VALLRVDTSAAAGWTKPENKDYSNFIERLKAHLKRLDILDVNYRPLD